MAKLTSRRGFICITSFIEESMACPPWYNMRISDRRRIYRKLLRRCGRTCFGNVGRWSEWGRTKTNSETVMPYTGPASNTVDADCEIDVNWINILNQPRQYLPKPESICWDCLVMENRKTDLNRTDLMIRFSAITGDWDKKIAHCMVG